MVKEQETVMWDTRKGGMVANKELRIGSIVLQSKPINTVKEEQIAEAICKTLEKEGENLLHFDEKMIQLQNRILSLRIWNPPARKDEPFHSGGDEQWPDVSTEQLIRTASQWLIPYLKGVKKNEDLKRIDLYEALYHSLDWEMQNKLNTLAPAKLEVPSGSSIFIEYFPNGATPVLSVRLQEVFGLSDTPTVNSGKIKVVMHLLSPGYKPVQVTTDLKSFWNNLYHEVKKELQRRYPKHSWPDDPWTADAVAKGRSRK